MQEQVPNRSALEIEGEIEAIDCAIAKLNAELQEPRDARRRLAAMGHAVMLERGYSRDDQNSLLQSFYTEMQDCKENERILIERIRALETQRKVLVNSPRGTGAKAGPPQIPDPVGGNMTADLKGDKKNPIPGLDGTTADKWISRTADLFGKDNRRTPLRKDRLISLRYVTRARKELEIELRGDDLERAKRAIRTRASTLSRNRRPKKRG